MRVLTGIKPTNILHLGNYFGALLPAVELQKEHDLYMMVADLHAITVPQDPKELSENTALVIAAYLAAGIDPKKTCLFAQSHVPAHTELSWLFECLTKIGEAERMTQFKDKSRVKGESVSVGLLTYPILMAADILLYQTEAVPVGDDQKQHIEIARDIAERFNKTFGQTFTLPKPLIGKTGARIMGLDDPAVKMSKSTPSAKNYISLLDSADDIAKKVKSAVTDSESTITLDDNRSGIKGLLTLLALTTRRDITDVAKDYADKGTKALKDDLSTALVDFVTPLQKEIASHLADRSRLMAILAQSAEKARATAAPTLLSAKQKMGLTLA